MNFSFEVIEECSPENRVSLEQHFIDLLSPDFNICRTAASTAGVRSSRKGKTLDLNVETRFNMGSAWRGKSLPDTVKENMSKTRRGRTKTEDWKKNISESVKARHSKPSPAMIEGRKGTAKGNSEWRWITNGVENRRVHVNQLENIDEDFYRGRVVKK